MSWVAVGVAGAGAVAGTAGSMLGAASQTRAGRQARDWQNARTSEGYDRLLGLMYGQAGVDARVGADGQPARGGNLDLTGVNLARAQGGSLDSQMRNNVRMSRVQGNQIVGDFNAGAQASDQLARGAESIARGYGRGAEDLINQDATRALTGANSMALGELSRRGLGTSSLVGNQVSENAANIGREATRAKIGVRRDTADRVLQARSQTLATTGNNTARRAGLQAANLDRVLGTRTARQNTLLSAATGPIANMWNGVSATPFYPGYSAVGSGLASAGGTLSTVGGFLAGQQAGGGQVNTSAGPMSAADARMYEAHNNYGR